MKKKIIIIVLLLLAVLAGAFIYINSVILPAKIQEIGIEKAETFLERKVTISGVHYELGKGIVITDLTIFRKDQPGSPFVQIKEVSFNIVLPAIIKNQSVIIPSVNLKTPYVHLIRGKDAVWNFADLLSKHSSSTENKKLPFSFFVGGVKIQNGVIELTDLSEEAPFHKTLQLALLDVSLSLKKGVKFSAQSTLDRRESVIEVNGNYDLLAKKLEAVCSLRGIDVPEWLQFLKINPGIELRQGLIEDSSVNITYQKTAIQAAGQIRLNIDAGLPDGSAVKGRLNASDFKLDFADGKTTLQSAVTIEPMTLTTLPETSVTGQFSSPEMRITHSSDGLSVNGAWEFNNAVVHFGENREIRGNIRAEETALAQQGEGLQVSGRYQIQNSQIRWDDLSLNGLITFAVSQASRQNGIISAAGNIQIDKPDLHVKTTALSGQSLDGKMTISQSPDNVSVNGSLNVIQAALTNGPGTSLTGNVHISDGKLTLAGPNIQAQSQFQTENFSLTFQDYVFTGTPSGNVLFRLEEGKPAAYNGEILLTKSALNGIPTVKTIDNINGKIKFKDGEYTTDQLTLSALQTELKMSGRVSNPPNGTADIKIQADPVDMALLTSLAGQFGQKLPGTATGTGAIALTYHGALNPFSLPALNLTAQLKNTQLQIPQLKTPITDISGQLGWQNEILSWKNLKGTFDNKTYQLEGEMSSPNAPEVDTTVSSTDFNISTRFKQLKDRIQIKLLTGRYYETMVDLNGEVQLKEGAAPFLDLQGKCDLKLTDLLLWSPDLAKTLKPAKLDGRINVSGSFLGRPDNWIKAKISAEGTSPSFSLYGFEFTDFKSSLVQGGESPARLDAVAGVYGGQLNITSSGDPQKTGFPIQLKGDLTNVDLMAWKKANKWKKNLSGQLSVNLNLEGPLLNQKELTGQGSIKVIDGHLLEVSLLRGLWKALLIPEMEDIIFTEAGATFDISNGKATTQDMLLTSREVDIQGQGWIDFDKRINFTVKPEFKEAPIIASDSPLKGATRILTQAGQFVNINVTGTIDKPNYTTNAMPGKALGKTTESILQGVGGILEDIFK